MALLPSQEDRKERKIVLQRRIELELTILVIAVVLFLKFTPKLKKLMESFELRTVDLRFDLRGHQRAPNDVVLVTIDDRSLQALGQWPWPRKIHGQLVRRLKQLGAKAIVFDVLFIEPSLRGPADDQYFADAIRDAGNVFLPIYNVHDIGKPIPQNASQQVSSQFLYPANLHRVVRQVFEGVVAPLPMLSRYARGFGTVTLNPDVDGEYRRVNLFVGQPGEESIAYPHIAIDVCRYVIGLRKDDIKIDPGGEVRMGDYVNIPVTGSLQESVYFYGDQKEFPSISYADAFDDSVVSKSMFANRIVVVGWTANGAVETDIRPTPLDRVRPGVGLNATVIDNIMKGDFMIETPEWVNVFMIILIGTMMGLIIIRVTPARGGMFTGTFFLAYLGIAYFFFNRHAVVLELISPTLVIFLTYAAVTAYRLGTEEREKRRIRETFGAYVTPQVVDELMKSPEKASLGGTRKEVSILFADVRGFTTMSEKMAPERVVEYLNDLFEPMNEVIFKYEGTIDNIIGDCLMAIFNAPTDQPDHAERAVQTGIGMLNRMKELQKEWREQGRPLLSMGIGINTGEVVVGNVGSSARKVYTVIGDDVNLAARLESLTRQYRVEIIIGEATYQKVKQMLRVRQLGEVVVKGKTQPVSIYEVLAIDGSGVVEPGAASAQKPQPPGAPSLAGARELTRPATASGGAGA